MKIPRFYQEASFSVGDEFPLSSINHRHAIQVLRLKVDDRLILFNGKGGEYQARLLQVDKRKSTVILEAYDSVNRESSLKTNVFLAMIKSERMDFAIQKLVELGISSIQPIYTQRSVIKIKENRLEKKMQHWKGVIIAACEQSQRTVIPEISLPKTLGNGILNNDQNCFVMLPGDYSGIKEQGKLKGENQVSLFIGPEGGFTDEEEQHMIENGVTPISFGQRILRAETAAIAGLTACQLEWGDL